MKRLYLTSLENWLSDARRKPLLVRGARQVGKSTLVRDFAALKGLDLIEVNLERHPSLKTAFVSMDPALVLREIEIVSGKGKLNQPGRLLFIDEIQEIPEAIPCLRYFYEEVPELPVLAAGSLLEFVLRDHEFSMPVGRVEYLYMGPCSFFEYLVWAKADTLLDFLTQ